MAAVILRPVEVKVETVLPQEANKRLPFWVAVKRAIESFDHPA
jgi:hypothetical protein